MKIDLHLHSKHSKRPSQWFLQKIGCPESFSEPDFLYQQALKKGMTGFTLTDHNIIDGCLELAGRPGVFISEEVTTYFPEDGCKAHVLVWNIDRIHEKIQTVRENIFDLAAYLQQNNLPHALAHPLFSINDKLTVEHFEKFLLLFKTMEMNGARDEHNNRILRAVLENLTPEVIDRLRRKHKIMPGFREPWIKFTVGGSDDHSALNIIRLYTQVPGAETIGKFFQGLKDGRSRLVGAGSGPRTMAHNIYGIAYQFYDHKLDIKRYSGYNVLVSLVDRLLNPRPHSGSRLVNRLKRGSGAVTVRATTAGRSTICYATNQSA